MHENSRGGFCHKHYNSLLQHITSLCSFEVHQNSHYTSFVPFNVVVFATTLKGNNEIRKLQWQQWDTICTMPWGSIQHCCWKMYNGKGKHGSGGPAAPAHRAVPVYRLNNFPKRQSIPALDTDPGPCLPGLPWVTQTMARGALQLEIYPTYHVSGAPWAGRHGISVITLVPGRFSPPNVVWVQART